MIGKIVGAIIGAEIDRQDGDVGVKGALAGATATGVAKRLVPVALVVAGIFVARKLIENAGGED